MFIKVMDFLLKYNSVLFAGVLAVCVSGFGAITKAKHERRTVITEAITKNRMTWISEVRKLLSDFIAAYIEGNKKKEMMILKAKIELYCRKGTEYDMMIEGLEICCQDQNYNEDHYNYLITNSQEVLRRVWVRVKIEGGIGKKEEKKVVKALNEFPVLKSDYN